MPAVDVDMEFGVLGPLLVRTGHPVQIGAPRQRIAMAALLMRAGQVVTTDELIELLWEERPPQTARASLRNQIMRLRRTLGDQRVIRTVPTGYVLDVSRARFDLTTFTELHEQGNSAMQEESWAKVANDQRMALALWRGPALLDIPSAMLQTEHVPPLTEMRLQSLEWRIEADLRLGRHDEIIGELRRLTDQHPLRERFAAQLMIALQRAARRAESLAVYQRTRHRLSEELGIEPGQELRELQARALRLEPADHAMPPFRTCPDAPQTVTLARASRGAPRARPEHVPREIGRPPGAFTGRSEDRACLDHMLSDPVGTAVALVGPAGAGKSALARVAAHHAADKFPDGQLYVDLEGASVRHSPLGPQQALRRMLRALGCAESAIPDDVAEAAARLRSVTAGRRLIILLDNAADAEQVKDLLPAKPCTVLVTSRSYLHSLDFVHHSLGPLSEPESLDLLAALIGRSRVQSEPAQALRIVRMCDRLPLPLRICGARLASRPAWTLRTLADRLAVEHLRLHHLSIDGLSLRASLSAGWVRLSADARGLLRLIVLLAWPSFGIRAAAELSSWPTAKTEDVLERLVDANLLESPSAGRYRLSGLARLFAAEQAEQWLAAADKRTALERTVEYYTAIGLECTKLLNPLHLGLTTAQRPSRAAIAPNFDRDAAIDWIDTERGALPAIATEAALLPDEAAAAALRFIAAVSGPLVVRCHWREVQQLNLLAAQVSRRLGDTVGEARAHLILSHVDWAYRRRGGTHHLRRSARMWLRSDGPCAEAHALDAIGRVHLGAGRLDEATGCFRRRLTILGDLGQHYHQVRTLYALGTIHQRLEEWADAEGRFREAASIAKSIGYHNGEAYSRARLASAYQRQGRTGLALQHLDCALELTRTIGAQYGELEILRCSGKELHRLGRERESRDRLCRAARLAEDIDRAGDASASRRVQHFWSSRW